MISLLILGDDGPDVLALEGSGDIPFLKAIDDLNLIDDLAILKDFKARALDDQVILILVHEFSSADPLNKLGLRILLGIIGIEAFFVLNKDKATRTDQVSQNQCAHICSVNRDPALWRRDGKIIIGRHPVGDRNATLREISG